MSGFFRLRNIVLLLPCVAVVIGLSCLKSAWAAILLYHAVIVMYLFLVRRERPRRGLFEGWNTPVGAGLILLCACCGPLLVLLWPVIENVQYGLSSTLAAFGLKGVGWWLFALLYVSFHPLLEELFWRDAMDPGNRRVDIVDVAFAAYHVLVLINFLKIPWVIVVFVILVMASWLWRRIAEKYQGLALPLLSHMTAGLGIMTAAYILSIR